jgi:hypothetical protein
MGDSAERHLDSFDYLYEEGEVGQRCCRLDFTMSPDHVWVKSAALRRAIEHFKSHEGVWFATRLDTEHWAKESSADATLTALF